MFKELFKSKGYKSFMKKLFWISLIVTIFGVLFYIKFWPGYKEMLYAGGGSLIVVGILKLIETITKDSTFE